MSNAPKPTAPKAPTATAPKPVAPTPAAATASDTATETASTETTTAKASGFKLDTGVPIPARRVVTGGNSTGTNYPFKDMPVGSSFLVEAEVPENTKAEEREAVFKDTQKRVANRMSGAIRRFKKANPDYNFVSRQVSDDTAGHGVRVWRIEAEQSASE